MSKVMLTGINILASTAMATTATTPSIDWGVAHKEFYDESYNTWAKDVEGALFQKGDEQISEDFWKIFGRDLTLILPLKEAVISYSEVLYMLDPFNSSSIILTDVIFNWMSSNTYDTSDPSSFNPLVTEILSAPLPTSNIFDAEYNLINYASTSIQTEWLVNPSALPNAEDAIKAGLAISTANSNGYWLSSADYITELNNVLSANTDTNAIQTGIVNYIDGEYQIYKDWFTNTHIGEASNLAKLDALVQTYTSQFAFINSEFASNNESFVNYNVSLTDTKNDFNSQLVALKDNAIQEVAGDIEFLLQGTPYISDTLLGQSYSLLTPSIFTQESIDAWNLKYPQYILRVFFDNHVDDEVDVMVQVTALDGQEVVTWKSHTTEVKSEVDILEQVLIDLPINPDLPSNSFELEGVGFTDDTIPASDTLLLEIFHTYVDEVTNAFPNLNITNSWKYDADDAMLRITFDFDNSTTFRTVVREIPILPFEERFDELEQIIKDNLSDQAARELNFIQSNITGPVEFLDPLELAIATGINIDAILENTDIVKILLQYNPNEDYSQKPIDLEIEIMNRTTLNTHTFTATVDFEGLIETSTNLATMSFKESYYKDPLMYLIEQNITPQLSTFHDIDSDLEYLSNNSFLQFKSLKEAGVGYEYILTAYNYDKSISKDIVITGGWPTFESPSSTMKNALDSLPQIDDTITDQLILALPDYSNATPEDFDTIMENYTELNTIMNNYYYDLFDWSLNITRQWFEEVDDVWFANYELTYMTNDENGETVNIEIHRVQLVSKEMVSAGDINDFVSKTLSSEKAKIDYVLGKLDENLKAYTTERTTTFNSFYDDVLVELDKFIGVITIEEWEALNVGFVALIYETFLNYWSTENHDDPSAPFYQEKVNWITYVGTYPTPIEPDIEEIINNYPEGMGYLVAEAGIDDYLTLDMVVQLIEEPSVEDFLDVEDIQDWLKYLKNIDFEQIDTITKIIITSAAGVLGMLSVASAVSTAIFMSSYKRSLHKESKVKFSAPKRVSAAGIFAALTTAAVAVVLLLYVFISKGGF